MKVINTQLPYYRLIIIGIFTFLFSVNTQVYAVDTGYRSDLIQQIVEIWKDTNEETSSSRWTGGMQAWLDKLSTDKLEEAVLIEDYSELTVFIKSKGQNNLDSFLIDAPSAAGKVYYSLPPCRIVDTRNAVAPYTGPIGANSAVEFHAKNNTQIDLQGGNSAGCNVPADADALVINITSVNQASHGYLTLYPADSPQPGSSILNFNGTDAIANSTILPICTSTCTTDFTVFASQSTHVIVDVMGYFAD